MVMRLVVGEEFDHINRRLMVGKNAIFVFRPVTGHYFTE